MKAAAPAPAPKAHPSPPRRARGRARKGHVCADGGCPVPGDIAKAYGGGADFVMLGGMLAGHDECEGEIRYAERDGEKVPVAMTFYGMSSETGMKKHSGGAPHHPPPA